MKVLSLDIGEKRIGIACGDTTSGVASPVAVLLANEVIQNARTFREILDDYMPEKLIIGLPKSMDGKENAQAKYVKTISEIIVKNTELPFEYVDERLSSAEAKRILREQGLSEKKMRGRVDSVAASLFLESWLSTF